MIYCTKTDTTLTWTRVKESAALTICHSAKPVATSYPTINTVIDAITEWHVQHVQDGGSVESYKLSDNLRYNVFIPRSRVEVLPSTEAIQ